MSIGADSTAAIDATGIATIVLALVTAVSVLVALYVARKAARDATDARNAQTFLQYRTTSARNAATARVT